MPMRSPSFGKAGIYGSQQSGASSNPVKWKPGATVQPVRVREQEIAVLVGYTS